MHLYLGPFSSPIIYEICNIGDILNQKNLGWKYSAMSNFLQILRRHKLLTIGLVVSPLGLYTGIKLKEYRNQPNQTKQPETGQEQTEDDELEGIRKARSSLKQQESLLNMELESIDVKLKRLDSK